MLVAVGMLGEELVVRTWREGDRIRPLGMSGTKTLGGVASLPVNVVPVMRTAPPGALNFTALPMRLTRIVRKMMRSGRFASLIRDAA